MNITWRRHSIAAVLITIITLSILPGVAAAETRVGGTVVIEEGTTIDSLEVMAGSVVIRGTVNGDVQGIAGSVVIAETGVIQGDLDLATGSLSIAGTVDGNVDVAAGSVFVQESGGIGGNLKAGAETVTIEGTIQGNLVAGAETIQLTSTAVVQGNLRHDTDTTLIRSNGATVNGQIIAEDNLNVGGGIGPVPVPSFGSWLLTTYGALVTLLIGVVLLAAFPTFTTDVADRVAESPLRSAGTGFLGLVGTIAMVIALAITIIGIPLALLVVLVFVVTVIVAVVLGEYAIGAWTLSLADIENRWAALVVGVVGVTLVSQLPYIGWIADVAAFTLGLGALLLGLLVVYRNGSDSDEDAEGVPDPTE